jgi:hypothetical protein
MKNARNAFGAACGVPGVSSFAKLTGKATIRGIGFFDFNLRSSSAVWSCDRNVDTARRDGLCSVALQGLSYPKKPDGDNGVQLRTTDNTASNLPRNEGVRGSSPRVGSRVHAGFRLERVTVAGPSEVHPK